MKSQAYWAVVKQHQLGDTNVDPDSQTLVVEHVVDLQEMEQHYYRFHQERRRDVKERQVSREEASECSWYSFKMIFFRSYTRPTYTMTPFTPALKCVLEDRIAIG